MVRQEFVRVGAAMFVAGLTACGGAVEVNRASGGVGGAGGSATTTSSSSAASSSSGVGGGLPSGFCAKACEKEPPEGSCFSKAICTDYCEKNSAGWTEAVGAAFAACAAENPLCFESPEGCMLSQLHPAGSVHTVRLNGSGFADYDGKTLHAWNDPGTGVMFGSEALIVGGAFAFTWDAPFGVWDTGGPLLLVYIDMDGDGACNPAADITHSVVTEWNKDLVDPEYSASLTPPLSDADFVCDYQP